MPPSDWIRQYIEGRRSRYMRQILDHFERDVEPLLKGHPGVVQSFKGQVRSGVAALAADAIEAAEGGRINGAAQQVRDRLHPAGRP